MSDIKYSRCVVSFTDILGFSDLVEKGVFSPFQIASFLRDFGRSNAELGNGKIVQLSGFKSVSFSDCTIRTNSLAANTAMSLKDLLEVEIVILRMIQKKMLSYGLLLRGAITVGDVVHSDIVFGPAFNRAYNLERTVAIYPRIIVDPELFLAEDLSMEDFLGGGVDPGDGLIFVDYLFSEQADLLSHKGYTLSLIKDAGAKPPGKVLAKHNWLIQYHNRKTQEYLTKTQDIYPTDFTISKSEVFTTRQSVSNILPKTL